MTVDTAGPSGPENNTPAGPIAENTETSPYLNPPDLAAAEARAAQLREMMTAGPIQAATEAAVGESPLPATAPQEAQVIQFPGVQPPETVQPEPVVAPVAPEAPVEESPFAVSQPTPDAAPSFTSAAPPDNAASESAKNVIVTSPSATTEADLDPLDAEIAAAQASVEASAAGAYRAIDLKADEVNPGHTERLGTLVPRPESPEEAVEQVNQQADAAMERINAQVDGIKAKHAAEFGPVTTLDEDIAAAQANIAEQAEAATDKINAQFDALQAKYEEKDAAHALIVQKVGELDKLVETEDPGVVALMGEEATKATEKEFREQLGRDSKPFWKYEMSDGIDIWQYKTFVTAKPNTVLVEIHDAKDNTFGLYALKTAKEPTRKGFFKTLGRRKQKQVPTLELMRMIGELHPATRKS